MNPALIAHRLAIALLASSALFGLGSPAHSEGRIRIAEQFGISFLPLLVIRDQQLIEKQARARGLDVTVEWSKLSGGASVNDALLSGAVDIGTGGIGPVLTIWDRTRGAADVKGIAALGSLPFFLVTRNANVRTLRDFTKADKIWSEDLETIRKMGINARPLIRRGSRVDAMQKDERITLSRLVVDQFPLGRIEDSGSKNCRKDVVRQLALARRPESVTNSKD